MKAQTVGAWLSLAVLLMGTPEFFLFSAGRVWEVGGAAASAAQTHARGGQEAEVTRTDPQFQIQKDHLPLTCPKSSGRRQKLKQASCGEPHKSYSRATRQKLPQECSDGLKWLQGGLLLSLLQLASPSQKLAGAKALPTGSQHPRSWQEPKPWPGALGSSASTQQGQQCWGSAVTLPPGSCVLLAQMERCPCTAVSHFFCTLNLLLYS